MKTRDEYIDQMLGYVGLFIIGVLGWTADRLAEVCAPQPRAGSRPSATPAIRKVNA